MLLIVESIEELFRLVGVMRVVGFCKLVEFAWELRGRDYSVVFRTEGGEGGDKRIVSWESGELGFREEGSIDVIAARN